MPVFKVLTNTAPPLLVRAVGELLEGAAKPVGSGAEGVVHLEDQRRTPIKVINFRRDWVRADHAVEHETTTAWLGDPDPTELFKILAEVAEA